MSTTRGTSTAVGTSALDSFSLGITALEASQRRSCFPMFSATISTATCTISCTLPAAQLIDRKAST
ncbi:hypothetical protein [Ralstonia solanacearum]|uniref:hypothetical protein n=1 Tax=Ralstonia solanacearum TaxID=305 RepID=UPI0012D80F10|nr:hypothetical protein [Ralstonia solanacearum]